MNWEDLRLLILDVDGVLTDGRLWDGAGGPEAIGGLASKAFHVQDGYAIKLWQRCGGATAILSGRRSPAVERRAAELGIAWCRTGSDDKLATYHELLKSAEIGDEQVAYVGDDLPDVPPMTRCAFPVAVRNAVPAVKRWAEYVTKRCGGDGAVAEIVELVLRKQRRWTGMVQP